eukprot:11200271-Karenia_brevis.AAC.1
MSWMLDIQVGAIQNPSIQCWVCGQRGHMGTNCPSKGKGKGDSPAGKGGPPVGKGGSKGGPPVSGVPGKGVPGVKGGGVLSFEGKGAPVGMKGLGKGYPFQGFCWKCGVKGYRSFECPHA